MSQAKIQYFNFLQVNDKFLKKKEDYELIYTYNIETIE